MPSQSPRHPRRCHWLFAVVGVLTIVTASACAPALTTHRATATPPARELAPGIPDRPDLVTVIPFFSKPNETDQEQTKAVIEATVDGHRGVFIFDLGASSLWLNRDVLQPNAQGGVDTVTDANRTPDYTPRTNYVDPEGFTQFDKAHVTVQMGTLTSHYDWPQLTAALGASNPHQYNAVLGHLWGNFGWVFGPRMGNIGPAVIAPFEAIVDYTHKRVVLITLDSVGHRLVDVPAYTPRWTEPLWDLSTRVAGLFMLGIRVTPGNALDTLDAANNVYMKAIDTGAPDNNGHALGYPFLSQFGAFGINQRTHQFILYHGHAP